MPSHTAEIIILTFVGSSGSTNLLGLQDKVKYPSGVRGESAHFSPVTKFFTLTLHSAGSTVSSSSSVLLSSSPSLSVLSVVVEVSLSIMVAVAPFLHSP